MIRWIALSVALGLALPALFGLDAQAQDDDTAASPDADDAP